MTHRTVSALVFVLVVGGCTTPQPPATQSSQPSSRSTKDANATAASATLHASAPDAPTSDVVATPKPTQAPDAPAQLEPDGNDEPENEGQGNPPASGHFERVGKAPIALRQICDLTPFGDALYAAHALAALGADGATLSRYRVAEEKRPFTVAFDWNRPGQPSKGGGAGQGFLRIRNIGGRLYVPDADPPYAGFGLIDWGTEGYVFVSTPEGRFAPAMRPNARPPGRPSIEGKAGAAVVPRAYHVFDVIRFRGKLMTSTGSVPPKEKAWYGPSPGALHVATPDLARFDYAVSYPYPYTSGVYRLTYLTRFKDKLYAGIEDYDGRAVHDLVVLEPPRDAPTLTQEDVRPLRITESGAAQTLRFFTHRGTLYWIAWARDGVRLRVSRDGEHFTPVPLPGDAGAPLDLVAFRGALFVLSEWGLYRVEENQMVRVARVTEKKSPFTLRDALCAAPLAVYENALYAGGQTDGSLYRFVED